MGSKVPTTSEWIERATNVHNGKYDYSKVIYTSAQDKVTIICPEHGEFQQRPVQHMRGEGCKQCGAESRGQQRRKTKEQFIAEAKEIHGDRYDYSMVDYKNSREKVAIICPIHGEFPQTPAAHIHSGQGCPACASNQLRDVQDVIAEFKEIHGDKYDYSKVAYTNIHNKVTIICPEHGEFEQIARKHIEGLGCSKCSGTHQPSTEEWINRARTVYGDRFDYSQVEYKTTHTPVVIVCKEHNHTFKQSPMQHLKSDGCQQCENEKSKAMWMERYGVHHHKLKHIDPSSVQKLMDPQWIITQNAVHKRTATDIASELNVDAGTVQLRFYDAGVKLVNWGPGVSQAEREIERWLTADGLSVERNTRSVISPKELDFFIPSHNLAIEYCGLYWHSDDFREPNYHLNKLKMCQQLGIRLITIFEDEWIQRPNVVREKIMNALGRSTNATVYARKCQIVSVSSDDKKVFLDANHIQGSGPGSITYGLMHEKHLVAVMTFIEQPNGRFDLNRYATSCNVPGGFTKLLAHFKHHNNWCQIVSFADLRWSEGKLYQQCGFTLDKTLPPDYYYWYGTERFHKFSFRHKNLANVLGDQYDPTLTERENMDKSKYKRIWNCGLLRYVVNNPHLK